MSQIGKRKLEHIYTFSSDEAIERKGNYFERFHLTHRALPELNFDTVSTATMFLRKQLSMPFLISSMTGGIGDDLTTINRHLAEAAEAVGVAFAVGSQRIMLRQEQAKNSFQVRRYAPSVPIIANLGAIQLNYGVGYDDVMRLVEHIEADALYLHLNALQECIQPEGNRNFAALLEKIAQLNDALPVPLIIKEVGCGFSVQDLRALQAHGITWVDVAGRGGTSWSRVESHRRSDDLGLLFQDWGIDTPQVIQAARIHTPSLKLVASGGVRNGIDMLKAIALGAKLCAMAAPLLQAALQDTQAVVQQLTMRQLELKTALFLTGCADVQSAYANESLFLSQ